MQDIFIACVDGLKGFSDAIEAVFPKTTVQLCIVHMVQHSLNYVSWKRRPEVTADLRLIYQPPTAKRQNFDSANLKRNGIQSIYLSAYPGGATCPA